MWIKTELNQYGSDKHIVCTNGPDGNKKECLVTLKKRYCYDVLYAYYDAKNMLWLFNGTNITGNVIAYTMEEGEDKHYSDNRQDEYFYLKAYVAFDNESIDEYDASDGDVAIIYCFNNVSIKGIVKGMNDKAREWYLEINIMDRHSGKPLLEPFPYLGRIREVEWYVRNVLPYEKGLIHSSSIDRNTDTIEAVEGKNVIVWNVISTCKQPKKSGNFLCTCKKFDYNIESGGYKYLKQMHWDCEEKKWKCMNGMSTADSVLAWTDVGVCPDV